jgi:hypothetical protein
MGTPMFVSRVFRTFLGLSLAGLIADSVFAKASAYVETTADKTPRQVMLIVVIT